MTTLDPGDRKSMECAATTQLTAIRTSPALACLGEGLVAFVRATLDTINCIL